ncbi:MAG TPA: zinc ribbon domain-containing protein [Gemmatimonadales bacterium]|nr:zinc ribbon domain-containing protein [Gemmatimonadales bacterium]
MPIYTYQCSACGTEFDQLVRNGTVVVCSKCQSRKLERKISLPARAVSAGKPADFSSLGPPAGGGGCCGGGCHTHHH